MTTTEPISQTITITQSVYDRLYDDSCFLQALSNAGVDNWEGYDQAVREYEELKEAEGD